MTVEFYHGALSDPYEQQANEQGFTLGEEKELLEKLGFSLVLAHIHGLLPDGEYSKALARLQKKLVRALRPLNKTEGGASHD